MERENVFFISIFLFTFYCSFLDSTSVPRLKFQRLQFTLQFLDERYVTSIISKLEATEDGLICTLTKTDFEGDVCELLMRPTTLHSTGQDGQTSKPACSLYLPFYPIRALFIYQKIPEVFVVPARLRVVPIFPQGQQSERNASARKNRLFSHGVIFTRAHVSFALLSLRKNRDYSQSRFQRKISESNRTSEKVVLFFPDGMFQTDSFLISSNPSARCLIPVSCFRGHFSVNETVCSWQ